MQLKVITTQEALTYYSLKYYYYCPHYVQDTQVKQDWFVPDYKTTNQTKV